MKDWVNMSLSNMRNNIDSKKSSMKNVGMPNQYQKDEINIDNVKINNNDSDVKKILRQEGIYNIRVMEDFITIINKNKKLCHII